MSLITVILRHLLICGISNSNSCKHDISMFPTMKFFRVLDTFFPPNVDPCHGNSEDEDMAVIVGGGTAFVEA